MKELTKVFVEEIDRLFKRLVFPVILLIGMSYLDSIPGKIDTSLVVNLLSGFALIYIVLTGLNAYWQINENIESKLLSAVFAFSLPILVLYLVLIQITIAFGLL